MIKIIIVTLDGGLCLSDVLVLYNVHEVRTIVYCCCRCFIADNSFPNLHRGVVRSEMRNFITRMLNEWQIQEQLRERALDAVEFQYTHWADPENNTARGQEYINVSAVVLITGHDKYASVVTFTVVASHCCCFCC